MIKTVILFMSISLMFLSCDSKREIVSSGKKVTIGVLAPLTGVHQRFGVQGLAGLTASQKMQRHLKNGDEILFKVIDTQSTKKGSKKAFYELVDLNVSVIISFMGSTETLYIREDIQRVKKPIIATLATDDNLTSINGYIAQVCMDNNTQVIVASHYIRDEKLMESVGIVYNSNIGYFTSIAQDFEKYFTQLGGKVKFMIDISDMEGVNEFNSIKNSSIEMLFNSTDPTLTMQVAKIYRDKKFSFGVLGVNGLLHLFYYCLL